MKQFTRILTMAVVLFMSTGLSYSQITEIFDTPGLGSWTVPCGVSSVTIAVYGGGGGGGGSNSNTIGGGAGGAGGYAEATFGGLSPGDIIGFTIGAGGAGGGPAGSGVNGGQTNLNPFSGLTAFGGIGGLPENSGGIGGAGGTGSAWAINVTGGAGTNGVDPVGGQGGAAGGPNGGGGGAGGGAGVPGGIGGNYGGGGGGGGEKSGGLNPTGGAGANGAVVITYNSTVTQPTAGLDVSTCNVVFLQGNAPDAGWTGTWNIISGTPIIANINDPNSLITIPVPGTCAVVEWEFTMPGCIPLTDQVQICYPNLCNDDPCGAIPLVVGSGSCSYSAYSNNGATASSTPVEPGCGSWSDNDAWYSAVVPASGILTVSSTDQPGGPGMIMGMSLYTEGSGGCNDMIEQGCDNATSSADVAEITYTGTPGETVYIRVWDFFENEATYQVCAFGPSTPMGTVMPGATTVACGPTMTFFDPGGNGGNYLANTTSYYVLCPGTPGQSVTVDFTTGFFATEFGFDFLTILDGAADSSYIIGQYSGTGAANNPGIVTSTAADGCLTLIFASDNSNQNTGWDASVYCSPTPATPNDSICSGTDCPGECGTWICETGLYPTENIGNNYEDMNEADGGCFDNVGEVASQWFYFTGETAGAIELAFSGPGGQDYNFAIYGPSTNGVPPCPQNTQQGPIICSQADVSNYLTGGITGLSNTLGGTESFEGTEGDGWVGALNILPGETYAMVVNIYQNGGPQPVIDLTIGGNGSLDCTPVYLPIELHSFTGVNQGDQNLLNWVTSAELNNDYFTIERSINGFDWEVVDYVDGAGTSQRSLYYSLIDYEPYFPVSYYRISQTDFDGTKKVHDVIAVNSEKSIEGDFVSKLFPNPSESYATFTYGGHDSDTPLTVTMVNELGAVVMEMEYNSLYKGMPMTLRTDALSGGMYQVVFTQAAQRDVQKFTLIK